MRIRSFAEAILRAVMWESSHGLVPGDAEGATAPESLRQMDRMADTILWKAQLPMQVPPKG